MAREGLNDRQFGQRIGVGEKAVRRYRSGERTPRDEHMDAILRETDGQVTPNDFFEVRRKRAARTIAEFACS